MNKVSRPLYLIFGWVFFVVGVVGVFIPLLPTTPFMILAAFCFSRGSEKAHTWLLNHKHLGPPIRDWETKGIIRRSAKQKATLAVMVTFSATLILVPVSVTIKSMVLMIGFLVLAFIWTRSEN